MHRYQLGFNSFQFNSQVILGIILSITLCSADYHSDGNSFGHLPLQTNNQPGFSIPEQSTSSVNPSVQKWFNSNFQIGKQILPPDVVRITKTVAIRVPYPKIIYVPRNIPYPVPYPISKPFPVEVPKIVDLQGEQDQVPSTISHSSDVESAKTIEEPSQNVISYNQFGNTNAIQTPGTDWLLQNQQWLQLMPPVMH